MPQPSMDEMISLFKANLELCKVGHGEKLAVLSEGAFLKDYAEAFLRAGDMLGAETVRVHLDPDGPGGIEARSLDIGRNPLSEDPAAMATLKEADMVVDLMLLLFSREQIEIQTAGTRVLMVVEPFEILKRLFPTEDQRRRVEAGERRLQQARTLRFTNKAGTDVRYELAELSGPPPACIMTEYGFTDTPGRWDHWPGGFLASIGTPSGVEGKVVMDRGDIILPHKTMLRAPIEMTIRDGSVVDIQGGDEARHLREHIERFEDPRAYAVSHIGWGLNERAEWSVEQPGAGQDARAYYGNVLFSLGPDIEFGRSNDTPCHLDLPMANCSLWLDDELIIQDGQVVPDDMRIN
jgi:2,5-dihydroxypyridine 5,6-dioxygenase